MPNQHRSGFSSRAISFAGGMLLAGGPGLAVATDWAFDPKVTAGYEFNDNIRMSDTPGQEIKVSGAAIDAQLEMRGETPRTTFQFIPRLRSTMFPSDRDQETDNQYLQLSLQHDGQRADFSANASYDRVETLGAYFPAADGGGGLGDPDPGEGVGRSTTPNREDRFAIEPSFTFDISERHGIKVDAGYLDVMYDHQVAADREDFKYTYGTIAYLYKLSPSKTLSFDAGAATFKQNGGGFSEDSQTAGIKWSNKVSETSEVYVRVGANRSKADIFGTNTGFSGGAGIHRAFEITDVFVDLDSDLDPNASGQLVQRNQLRFQISRELSPLTTLKFGARGIQDGRTGSDNVFVERKYATGFVGLAWRFSRQWTLGGVYTYVWRDYQDQPNAAEANRLNIDITYEPHRL